jgi:hypothetical protein
MFRTAALLSLTLVPSLATAQPQTPPARFKWVADQTLTYKVSQQTIVRETTLDPQTEKPVTTEAKTNLTLVKKWTVKAVDANGIGTLEMTITAMRNEFVKPDGKSVVVDSANPDDAKQMAGYLNVAVMTVRVDARGQIVEVKEAKPGTASRLHAELPFRLTLPDAAPAIGTPWDRTFTMKLDPPLGTGESYEFSQKFTPAAHADGLLSASVETTLKAPPKALAERVPLVPMLWTGNVYFNTTAGKYHAARLTVKAELPNHLGEGTKFEYQAAYNEDFVEK